MKLALGAISLKRPRKNAKKCKSSGPGPRIDPPILSCYVLELQGVVVGFSFGEIRGISGVLRPLVARPQRYGPVGRTGWGS